MATPTIPRVVGVAMSQIGTSPTDPAGMHGFESTQASAITQVGTSVPVAACASFGLTSTQLTAIVTGLNAVIVALANKGITA